MDIPEPRIQIAPMTMDTVEDVAALEIESFAAPWSLDALVGELSNPIAVYYTAMLDDKVVGYIGMHHIVDEGYINNVAVTSGHRRRGVATALLSRLLHYAKENELRTLTLEVRASNGAAIALYEDNDFEQVGQRKGYYTVPTEDAVLMTLTL